jgi:ABC-type branched-subunit amino acid transport system substrate-binding protein
VLFGPYGTWPAVTAARASVGVVWNHGGAAARLAGPEFERVVNLPLPARTYLAAVLDTLVAEGLPAGSEIVLLHRDTGFGREVAEGTAAAAARLGLVVHAVSFALGEGPEPLERAPGADVLLSAGSFEDDVAIAAPSALSPTCPTASGRAGHRARRAQRPEAHAVDSRTWQRIMMFVRGE